MQFWSRVHLRLVGWSAQKAQLQISDGGFLYSRQDVAVNPERERRSAVPQTFLNDLGVYALLQEQRRVTVAEIVEPDHWYLRMLRDPPEIAPHEIVCPQRLPVRLAKDEPVVFILFAE